jgi:RNA polymerase sigma-70 factor (ECF subfamily)
MLGLLVCMPEGEKRPKNEAKKTEEDFLAAFDEHSDALFRHCLVRVRDREVAKDIVQETFTKTWNYLAKGKKVDHLRAFLYRVANNLIVDTSRRKRSSSLDRMMEEDGYEVADESIRDPGNVPDARLAMKLLETLDDIYRVVITMRFVDGFTPKEIAQTLGVSENVVSVRIYRGIERLKGIVNEPRFHA